MIFYITIVLLIFIKILPVKCELVILVFPKEIIHSRPVYLCVRRFHSHIPLFLYFPCLVIGPCGQAVIILKFFPDSIKIRKQVDIFFPVINAYRWKKNIIPSECKTSFTIKSFAFFLFENDIDDSG